MNDKNKEAMEKNAQAIKRIMAPTMERAAKSIKDFEDYLENRPPKAVVVVANDSYPQCKCGSTRGLTKYKGKYYCQNCLNKKLRW